MYWQTVTPAQASAWLEFTYVHQRPLSALQVNTLALAISEGRFTTNTIKFCLLNGSRHLVNGQHTLRAIIKSGCVVKLPVMDFTVSSENELAEMYAHEDIGRRRTMADSLRAYDVVASTGLSLTYINYLVAALRHIKSNFGENGPAYKRITHDDLVFWVSFWSWEMRQVLNLLDGGGRDARNMILKRGTLDVALITLRFAPDKAREFWRQVIISDGLDRFDPRLKLREWLLLKATKRGDVHTGIPPAKISRASIHAWNTWMEGGKLRRFNIEVRPEPVKILGTYYSGNQSSDYLPLSESPNMNGNSNGNGHA